MAKLDLKVVVSSSRDVLSVQVKRSARVRDVKQILADRLRVRFAVLHLYFRGTELLNDSSLWECWVQDGSTLILISSTEEESEFVLQPVGGWDATFVRLPGIAEQCRVALAHGRTVKLAMDGEGGTYFLPAGKRQFAACFKPRDEEAFAPNNPKTFTGTLGQRGLREGIRSGEAYLREAAAYRLDWHNFSHVPETMIAECRHTAFNNGPLPAGAPLPLKQGSLQEFVKYDELAADLPPKRFPTDEVHRIGILDIRLMNLDRNDANILVQYQHDATPVGASWEDALPAVRLIPIDHGFCMPATLEVGWCDWVWYEWPQSKEPFSQEALAYIEALDPTAEAAILKNEFNIRPECISTVVIATTILKRCAKQGMSLYDIATIMIRADLDAPSQLERMVSQAYQLAEYTTHNPRGRSKPRFARGFSDPAVGQRIGSAPGLVKSQSTGSPDPTSSMHPLGMAMGDDAFTLPTLGGVHLQPFAEAGATRGFGAGGATCSVPGRPVVEDEAPMVKISDILGQESTSAGHVPDSRPKPPPLPSASVLASGSTDSARKPSALRLQHPVGPPQQGQSPQSPSKLSPKAAVRPGTTVPATPERRSLPSPSSSPSSGVLNQGARRHKVLLSPASLLASQSTASPPPAVPGSPVGFRHEPRDSSFKSDPDAAGSSALLSSPKPPKAPRSSLPELSPMSVHSLKSTSTLPTKMSPLHGHLSAPPLSRVSSYSGRLSHHHASSVGPMSSQDLLLALTRPTDSPASPVAWKQKASRHSRHGPGADRSSRHAKLVTHFREYLDIKLFACIEEWARAHTTKSAPPRVTGDHPTTPTPTPTEADQASAASVDDDAHSDDGYIFF